MAKNSAVPLRGFATLLVNPLVIIEEPLLKACWVMYLFRQKKYGILRSH